MMKHVVLTRALIVVALLLAALLPAKAQNSWTTPGGSTVPGSLYLCLDAAGQAVPCATGGSESVVITAHATGTTGAVVGTLAAAAGVTTTLCGFDVSAIGGTAAVGPITVAGLVGGSFTYELASTATGVTLGRTFTPCIPASAVDTAITITTTADGTASAVAVNAWGTQQ
jgi:hypothetical protein